MARGSLCKDSKGGRAGVREEVREGGKAGREGREAAVAAAAAVRALCIKYL